MGQEEVDTINHERLNVSSLG